MLRAGMDMLSSGESGNCSFAWYEDPSSRSIILEAVFVLSA